MITCKPQTGTAMTQHIPSATEQRSINVLISHGFPEGTARVTAFKVHAHDELVAALCKIAALDSPDDAGVDDAERMRNIAAAALAKVTP